MSHCHMSPFAFLTKSLVVNKINCFHVCKSCVIDSRHQNIYGNLIIQDFKPFFGDTIFSLTSIHSIFKILSTTTLISLPKYNPKTRPFQPPGRPPQTPPITSRARNHAHEITPSTLQTTPTSSHSLPDTSRTTPGDTSLLSLFFRVIMIDFSLGGRLNREEKEEQVGHRWNERQKR